MKVKSSPNKVLFVCNSCGSESLRWAGRCPSCGQWNSLVEMKISTRNQSAPPRGGGRKGSQSSGGKVEVTSLGSIKLPTTNFRLQTGFSEFDRTVGGGLVPGQVVLLAGDPGIGKSTLLLQIAESVCERTNPKSETLNSKQVTDSKDQNSKHFKNSDLKNSNLLRASDLEFRVLYIAGEESPLQIKQRAERLGIEGEGIEIVSTTEVEEIISYLSDLGNLKIGSDPKKGSDPISHQGRLGLIIVDSIQTLTSADVASSAGSVAQVKICAMALTNLAKETGIPLIIIGHVNKEGDIAGPKVLEHIVDTVLYLEGERTLPYRLLRAVKNRFGDPSEVGVWENVERGFVEVKNPGLAFIKERGTGAGTILTVALEGNRPLLLEVQALTSKTAFGYPRRSTTGYDLNRLFFIIAVIEKHLKFSLQSVDIYVNVTGGIKISEPSADLAIALAIIGSFKNLTASAQTVVFGEVGLTGEVRSVALFDRRIKEAEKLGFKKIVAPGKVSTLKEAIAKALDKLT